MVEIAGTDVGALVGSATTAWSIVGWIGAALLILAVMGFFAYIYIDRQKYNKTVQVKRLYGNNQGKYLFDKAKRYVDSDGVEWWKLKGLRRLVTIPPEESLGMTAGGATLAFAVLDSNEQLTWVSHNFDFDKYKAGDHTEEVEIEDPKTGSTKKITLQKKAFDANYEPISTESKANWAYQRRRNERLRAGNWFKENIGVVASGLMLVFLVLGAMMIAPKIIEANTEFSAQAANTARAQAQAAAAMDEILITVNQMLDERGSSVSPPGTTPEAPN